MLFLNLSSAYRVARLAFLFVSWNTITHSLVGQSTFEAPVDQGSFQHYEKVTFAFDRPEPETMSFENVAPVEEKNSVTLLNSAKPFFRAEVGENDFRISNMGPDGSGTYDGLKPSIAYNSTDDEFLVVWVGDDNTGSLADNEQEVYGQRIDAATGASLGARIRVSRMGTDGVTTFGLYSGTPAVTWNDDDNEYLVVWSGEDQTDDDFEIWAARIGGGTSSLIGTEFRISDTGGVPSAGAQATAPDVVYNSTSNEYLVVWAGDEVTGSNSTTQVYGQRLTNTGVETGTNDFAISDLQISYDVDNPAVAWNSTDNEYLVVWESDDVGDVTKTARFEYEIYGQRLNASGAEIGTDDFRLSDMGGFGSNDADYDANDPDVAYNPTNNNYLVVWEGSDNTSPLVLNEVEIYGQFVSNSGVETGTNDFRISDMGDDGEMTASNRDNFRASVPAITYNQDDNEFMVAWYGDDDYGTLGDNENEIYAARISNTGTITDGDLRLTDVGPQFGNANFDAEYPGVAYSTTSNKYLVVFEAEDSEGTLVAGEHEIFGQFWETSSTNMAPVGAMLSDTSVDEDLASGDLVANLFGDDADVDDTHTFALVAGAGDTDNGSFTISGTQLLSNTTFSFGTQSVYNIRLKITDNSMATVEVELTITVNEPPAVISGVTSTISDNGGSTDADYDALDAKVAYNATNDEYLVVWEGDDDSGSLVNDENEIWAQRIDATDGSKIGSMIRVSSMGGTGDASYDGTNPSIAWNDDTNQYLVVWEGNHTLAGLAATEKEIWGQLVTNTGSLSGSMIRISDAGPDGTISYSATLPEVVYNTTSNQFLVVWKSDDNVNGLVDNEIEIFGQFITSAGAETGTNDFQISDAGGSNGDGTYDADNPAVAWNSTDNEYLVVWEADDNENSVVNDEKEIFAERLSAAGVSLVSDLKVSNAGPVGDKDFDADDPGVVYNPDLNKYFVAWEAEDNTGALVDNEKEVYGQSITNLGALDGSVIRISSLGPDGSSSYDGENPELIYISAIQEYIVVFFGENNTGQLASGEEEIWAQRIRASTGELIDDVVRMTETGVDGNINADAFHPDIAYSPTQKKALIAFYGDGDTDGKNTVLKQLWQVPPPSVTTLAAGDIADTSVKLNGSVNANGISSTVTFEYGLTTAYGQTATATQSPLTATDNEAVSKTISGLTKNTTYHFRVKAENTGGTSLGADQTFTTTNSAPSSITLAATVYLEGAFNGTNLNTTLNANIPTSQPYSINGHAGAETAGSIPANAVDWVLVELREAGSAAAALSATKVGSAAGILMNDGTIKATDGTSDLTVALSGNTGSDFFIVIYHRNHLPVMSASAISESSSVYTIDFTSTAANAHAGVTGLASLSGSKFGMLAGDADGDGDVDATDLTTWQNQNGITFSYNTTNGDFNLDGEINAVDRNDFQQKNNSKASQVPTT
ncbi:MAG: hypothetical protein Roseis2KO_44210 [Roseivirga sp.]